MIRLSKKLYFNTVLSGYWHEFPCPIIGVLKDGHFTYRGLRWCNILQGRKIAYKKGYIKDISIKNHRIVLTKLGEAMLNLMK